MAVVGLAGVAACSSASTPQTNAGATGATGRTSAALTANDLLNNPDTPLLFPTGVDADGNSLAFGDANNPPVPDPHYTVTSDPPDPNCTGHAYAISVSVDNGGAPVVSGHWADPTPPAQWISCATPTDQGTVDPAGNGSTDYTYTTTLTIPAGVPASTVQVTGDWACDNWCWITVNGGAPLVVVIGGDTVVMTQPADLNIAPANFAPDAFDDPNDAVVNTTDPGYKPTGSFTIPAGTFQAGDNTINFVVRNTASTTDNQDNPAPNPEGLLINDITMTGGCAADADCGDGNTCDTDTSLCTLYPNGQGNCSTDNTAANNAATVCQSGACGSDGKCGLAPGEACTQDATQCRFGRCGSDNTCADFIPCNDDGSCADDSMYCDQTNGCVSKQPNGEGSSCTADNAAIVCQSGACSTNGTCMPAGGCNVNEDCTASQPVCDAAAHQCVPTEDAGSGGSTSSGGGSSCSVPAGTSHGAGFGSVAGVTAIALAGLIRRRRSSR